jgi:hypothetical protein
MSAPTHAWRDDTLSAEQPYARQRTRREWLEAIKFADDMGWLSTEQWRAACDELDRKGRVFSAAEAEQIADDDARAVEADIIHKMWTQGLSACPVGRAA